MNSNNQITWYEYTPVDTIFCKGAEPMEMGENHTTSTIFPPMPNTITGALRTAVLREHNISIENYYKNDISPELVNIIGKAGEDAHFQVIGPLFMFGMNILLPTPYHWFYEKKSEKDKDENITVFESDRLDSETINSLSIHSSAGENIYWTKGENAEVKTLGSNWVSDNLFTSKDKKNMRFIKNHEGLASYKDSTDIIKPSCLFTSEQRTGISLEEKHRTVKSGCLYTFTHYRLYPEVKLIFGINKNLPLSQEGILSLGGEQRFGKYNVCTDLNFLSNKKDSQLYMNLSHVKACSDDKPFVVATGKLKYVGGWDMKKRFHKPTTGYYPPGTVFSKEIVNNLVAL